MYLSRLFLNPRSRQVRSELANPYEFHRTICRAFPGANYQLNEPLGVLFRVDLHPRTGVPTLLVQSRWQPDWSFLLVDEKSYLLSSADCPSGATENPATKTISLDLYPGQRLLFRLKANPTFKTTVHEPGKEDRKTRRGLVREEDQLKWLDRKLESAGASVISVRTSNQAKLTGERKREDGCQSLTFISVQFDGLLSVREPDQLLATLESGIGSGKGLGFGLLSLAPVRG